MANTGTQCITEFLLMAFHRKALALFFPGIANHAPGKWRDCAAYATITASLLCRNCMVSHCKSTHQLLTACDLSLTPAPTTYQVVDLGSVIGCGLQMALFQTRKPRAQTDTWPDLVQTDTMSQDCFSLVSPHFRMMLTNRSYVK